MPNESSFPYTPRPHNYPQQSAEDHPRTGTHVDFPWPNGHQPGVNYAGPCHGRNDANYGNWTQSRNNVWNEGHIHLRQYTYQRNPNVGYAPPGDAQHYLATPGPPPVEYYIPPSYGMPNGPVRDHAPPTAMPDVADPL